MSRFTVGQEITPKKTCTGLKYGKFYRVYGRDGDLALVTNDSGQHHAISNKFGLTREEYEQAEREKDPFAPGKWVVCVKDDSPAKVGDVLLISDYSGVYYLFRSESILDKVNMPHMDHFPYRKYNFRPATPEEIKEQEMKIMDEKKCDEKIEIAHVFQIDPDIFTTGRSERVAEPDRQTFYVTGREFYVGQTVWTTMKLGVGDKGTALAVVGCDLANKTAIIVKEPDTVKAFSITADGRISTTEPKPHEWKFGDWARHPELGAVFVTSGADADGDIEAVMQDGEGVCLGVEELTYISTAEIPE